MRVGWRREGGRRLVDGNWAFRNSLWMRFGKTGTALVGFGRDRTVEVVDRQCLGWTIARRANRTDRH